MAPHALSKKANAQMKSRTREELLSKAMESWKKTLVDAASRKTAIPKISSFLRNYPDVKETTFRHHLCGGRSRNAYAATCQLLTVPQADILVKFIIEMGEKGFPLTYKKISEYALAIIRANGRKDKSIGIHWAQWFVQRYATQIGAKTCTLLDKTRMKALNSTNVSAHFTLLSETMQKYEIVAHNLYNCDETGCLLNVPFHHKVVVSAKSKHTKSVQNASKEHITVLEFICANGSTLPPVVIFPGELLRSNWLQKNPLEAK